MLSITLTTLTALTLTFTVANAGIFLAGSCYWTCMAACTGGSTVMTAGVGGLFGIAACASLCGALSAGEAVTIPGVCFADGTEVLLKTTDGRTATRKVESIPVGSLVATFAADGKQLAWTTVTSNERVLVAEDDVYLRLEVGGATDAAGGSQMTVTQDHLVIRKRTELGEGDEMVFAWQVKAGDEVWIHEQGGAVVKSVAEVERTAGAQYQWKNKLATEAGSVIADGVFTSAMCDSRYELIPEDIRKNATLALLLWQSAHE